MGSRASDLELESPARPQAAVGRLQELTEKLHHLNERQMPASAQAVCCSTSCLRHQPSAHACILQGALLTSWEVPSLIQVDVGADVLQPA